MTDRIWENKKRAPARPAGDQGWKITDRALPRLDGVASRKPRKNGPTSAGGDAGEALTRLMRKRLGGEGNLVPTVCKK